jgi:hypothetical protein
MCNIMPNMSQIEFGMLSRLRIVNLSGEVVASRKSLFYDEFAP